MILRPPEYSDRAWMVEAYSDWPKDYLGHEKVHLLLRRWIERGDVKCLVGETDVPVGLVTYRQHVFGVWIHNLVIHPDHRLQGHSKALLRALKERLVAEGAMVAGFKTLPGPYQDRYADNVFRWDMEI